jgi:hypothetical protein
MELTDAEQMIIESYQRILLHLSQVHQTASAATTGT